MSDLKYFDNPYLCKINGGWGCLLTVIFVESFVSLNKIVTFAAVIRVMEVIVRCLNC